MRTGLNPEWLFQTPAKCKSTVNSLFPYRFFFPVSCVPKLPRQFVVASSYCSWPEFFFFFCYLPLRNTSLSEQQRQQKMLWRTLGQILCWDQITRWIIVSGRHWLLSSQHPSDWVCYLETATLRFRCVSWPRAGLETLTTQVRTWPTGPAAALFKESHCPVKVF